MPLACDRHRPNLDHARADPGGTALAYPALIRDITVVVPLESVRAMAPRELLPPIQQLKDWRKQNALSQYEAARVLREAGLPVTTDSLQAWEIGRWNPRAHVALALAEFLQKRPKRRRGKRSRERGK